MCRPCSVARCRASGGRAGAIVASVDDAFIAHEPSSDLWTIGSRGLELAIGFGADHVLSLQRLSNPVSGRTLNITPGADVSLTAGGGRTTDFDDTLTEGISLAIASYKTFRDTIAIANATLLSDQAPVDESAWEVVQEVADATYDVRSIDAGDLGSATGAALMTDGIELVHAGGSRAHILILQAPAASGAAARQPRH